MVLKKRIFKSLLFLFAIGIQSFHPALGAQSASSDTDAAQTVSFPLENSLVGRYLKHADNLYKPGIGRSGISALCYWLLGTDVSPYMLEVPETGGLPEWPEQCAPVTFPAVKGGTVWVSSSPKFENHLTFSSQSSSVDVYNLIPQTIYWYKVFDANGKQVTKGCIKTQGKVRMIHTEKVLNVRDIGGWKCDGGQLAYGKIFRGAALEGITTEAGPVSAADITEFKKVLGIGSEIDLRNEVTLNASPLGTGVTYKSLYIDHYMYLLENTLPKNKVGSGDFYAKFASFVNLLISNMKAGKATYIHCKWGADRTGTVLALIEALCGVSEEDIVKDWELTSFNATCYRKYINQQEIKYYYKDSTGKLKSKPSELRAVFDYLYTNYGGASGATLKQQVTKWLQTKVYSSRSDKGSSIITQLRNQLITPTVQSPVLIKDLSKETDRLDYSVTTESTTIFNSKASKYIEPSTGKMSDGDLFSCTDFISCKGYSYLFLNAVTAQMGAFYDANKNFIGSIEDKNYTAGSVIFEDHQYSIPSNAAYIRLNMPKYCDWSAILSVKSIL